MQCRTSGEPILYVNDPKGMDRDVRRRSLDALKQLNELELKEFGDPETLTRIEQYELAYRMQMAVPDVMDIKQETQKTLEMYGAQPGAASFANNCLLARRLVERGVRYVQLFDWGWDCHGTGAGDDIVTHLPQKCKEIDRPIAALLRDLKQRGLLDETLVIWGGEFGRTSMNEARGGSTFLGRDHHPHCFTIWMAGAGIKAGDRLRRHRRAGLLHHRGQDRRPRLAGDHPAPARPRRLPAALPVPGAGESADRPRGRPSCGQGGARLIAPPGLQFPGDVANPDDTRLNDPGIDATQVELLSQGGIDERHRIEAEPRHELFTAGMGLVGDFDHSRSDPQSCPRRQIRVRSSPCQERVGPPIENRRPCP